MTKVSLGFSGRRSGDRGVDQGFAARLKGYQGYSGWVGGREVGVDTAFEATGLWRGVVEGPCFEASFSTKIPISPITYNPID